MPKITISTERELLDQELDELVKKQILAFDRIPTSSISFLLEDMSRVISRANNISGLTGNMVAESIRTQLVNGKLILTVRNLLVEQSGGPHDQTLRMDYQVCITEPEPEIEA